MRKALTEEELDALPEPSACADPAMIMTKEQVYAAVIPEHVLTQVRIRRSFSSNELADKIGVSYELYDSFESGAAKPTIEHIKAIAKALNANEEILLKCFKY
jgi:DNA-binding XRE family transcriptional regulator